MNPPTTRRNDPNAATPPDDAADAPLTGEDLIGDLDPGWLDWRDRQQGR